VRLPGGGLVWVSALAVVTSWSLSKSFEVVPILSGLDPSYTYALSYATVHRLAWGSDFVSTYGPYGFLISTLDVGNLVARKMALALLLVGAGGVAATVFVWREAHLSVVTRAGLLGLVLYAVSIQTLEYNTVALLVLLLLIGARERAPRGLVAFGLAGLLAGFCMLIKFSLGFGALLTVAISCALARRPPLSLARAGVAFGGAAASILFAWSLYAGSARGISAFLSSGWEMASGYSSAMSMATEGSWIGVAAFVVWFLLVAAWALSWRAARPLLSLAVLAAPLFVAWKHSVVRQDVHVKILIMFALFALTVLLVDSVVLGRPRRDVVVAAALALPLAIPWYTLPAQTLAATEAVSKPPCELYTLAGSFLRPLKLCGLRSLVTWTDPSAMRSQLEAATRAALTQEILPPSTRSAIGTASVDVYPWRTTYVPANGLAWANRPLPASFNSYTARLDRLNAAFFASERRPDYLLWHTNPLPKAPLWSLDGRYLLWDEPLTVRTILGGYDVVERQPGLVLLRSRHGPRPRFGRLEPVERQTVAWSTWVEVPAASSPLLAHAAIEASMRTRAVRTVFRESAVFVSLRFSSGEVATFRIVPASAASGFWVSPFAVTVEELSNLLMRGEGRKVAAIRFDTARAAGFYEPVTVTWSRLPLAAGTWIGAGG
jgi:hypothetical protein